MAIRKKWLEQLFKLLKEVDVIYNNYGERSFYRLDKPFVSNN